MDDEKYIMDMLLSDTEYIIDALQNCINTIDDLP